MVKRGESAALLTRDYSPLEQRAHHSFGRVLSPDGGDIEPEQRRERGQLRPGELATAEGAEGARRERAATRSVAGEGALEHADLDEAVELGRERGRGHATQHESGRQLGKADTAQPPGE